MENETEVMKEISSFECSEEEAEKEYNEYLDAVKTRKEKYLEDLKKVYYNLKRGKKVIDIFSVMKKAGLNENKEPRLAISRAGFNTVLFIKQNSGSGSFGNNLDRYQREWFEDKANCQVILPSNTFPEWETETPSGFSWARIKNKIVHTKVPIIPAHLLPNGNLGNYYILWEVKEWKALPPLKDPFLLKRISSNLFAVMAEWELTAIEQAVIAGQK